MIYLIWKVRKEKSRSPNNSQVSDFGIKRIGVFYFTEHLLCAKTVPDVDDSAVDKPSLYLLRNFILVMETNYNQISKTLVL